MIFKPNQDYWTNVYITEQFISIRTYSGLGRVGADPLFPQHLLEPDADHHTLGLIVLQALQNSRTLNSLDERVAFFDLTAGKLRYQAWYQELMQRYGYKTKKALFKNMQLCGIHCVNGIITIIPYRHEKLEAWGGEGIEESDYVVLSTASTPEEMGEGLRLAISRCR